LILPQKLEKVNTEKLIVLLDYFWIWVKIIFMVHITCISIMASAHTNIDKILH
jgi:hypothetical protein